MEKMLPIKNPTLQEMYNHVRREWWYACWRAYRSLVEASRYGPGMTGSNVSRAAENLVHYEAAMEAIRSADIQLRSSKTGSATG